MNGRLCKGQGVNRNVGDKRRERERKQRWGEQDKRDLKEKRSGGSGKWTAIGKEIGKNSTERKEDNVHLDQSAEEGFLVRVCGMGHQQQQQVPVQDFSPECRSTTRHLFITHTHTHFMTEHSACVREKAGS